MSHREVRLGPGPLNRWFLFLTRPCRFQIAERSAQLHEALLHCGRFQDALESLLSWLSDTEEQVANQKPTWCEFKVVKSQIQEQRVSCPSNKSINAQNLVNAHPRFRRNFWTSVME